jgi:exonuclease VII large subunit
LAVLARGYSITMTLPQRRVVTHADHVHPGDELETLLAKGRVVSAVTRLVSESTS